MRTKTNFLQKGLLIIIICLSFVGNIFSENPKEDSKQKIGLTLSGGGARGFVHIGILHIIDSLGIKVDYITGTSMGAIVGGMYASGYSAKEIEERFLTVNWDEVLSFRISIENSHPRTRETLGRHMISVPLEDGKIDIATGAIEGQQLWNTLGEAFFPVRPITDFSKLPIPFACIATDVETGEAVIMRYGDIVTAIRASMAFPTIFTAVERDSKKLIDGGVVLNFPVYLAKDMGADYVIGVYASQGLRKAEELNTPIDILMQMGYYKDAQNYKENVKKTDLYIEPDLKDNNAGNFRNVKEIIEIGKQTARTYIDDFINIKENIDNNNKEKNIANNRMDKFIVDSIAFHGLKKVRTWFVKNNIKVKPGDTINANIINENINQLYASGYFNRITYNISISTGNNKKTNGTLIFVFQENPFTNLYSSIHYNIFSGVGIIGEIATRKFLLYNTSAYTKFILGEKPAIKAGFDVFTGDSHRSWVNMETKSNYLTFPIHDKFTYTSEYKRIIWDTELTFNQVTGKDSYFSAGIAYYMQNLSPNKHFINHVTGNLTSYKIIGRWKINSLDKHAFPRSGQLFHLDITYFFGQSSSLEFYTPDGDLTDDLSNAGIELSDFLQTSFRWESNIYLNEKLTPYSQLQGGYNFMYEQGFLNMFNVGGTSNFLENQITFAGLEEYGVNTNSIISGGLGLRYNMWGDFYLVPQANIALFDFVIKEIDLITIENMIIGGGLDIGYDSAIGPIEITVSYSPQTGRVLPYINLGWSF